MATQVTTSPTRLRELQAKFEAHSLTEEEYVAWLLADNGEMPERYARRMYATAYQSMKISSADRPYMAV